MSVDEDKIIKELEEKYPISEDVSFDEYNISEKLQNHAFLLISYNRQLVHEKLKLEKIQEILDKKTGERYHHYRFDFNESLTKQEIERYYLPKDPELQKLKPLIQKQEIRVGFFTTAVKALESVQWSMKNYIDIQKRGL